jgi:hypothetical protein
MTSVPVPDQCEGESWLSDAERPRTKPRITEGLTPPSTYVISVERDGTKAIFVFDRGYPERPTRAQLDAGPVHKEYYDVEAVRANEFDDSVPPAEKRQLQSIATEFVRDTGTVEGDERRVDPDADVNEQLEKLDTSKRMYACVETARTGGTE